MMSPSSPTQRSQPKETAASIETRGRGVPRAVDDRELLAGERQGDRSRAVRERGAPRLGGLGRVAGADEGEPRYSAQRRRMLDRLVRRPVFAETDRVVRPD